MTHEGNLDNNEQNVVNNEFSQCDSYNATQSDIVLVYPDGILTKDVGGICQQLQNVYDLLCEITPVSPAPNEGLQSRIIIGFRHSKDESNGKECCAGWHKPQNRLNVPYSYLYKSGMHPITVDLNDNLEFCCSHELVHPFEDVFLEGNPNKHWNEGFCDCLRVLVLQEMGFCQYASDWEGFIKANAKSKKDKYHDAAGRVFLHCESNASDFRTNRTTLRNFIESLINQSMDDLLDPKD